MTSTKPNDMNSMLDRYIKQHMAEGKSTRELLERFSQMLCFSIA